MPLEPRDLEQEPGAVLERKLLAVGPQEHVPSFAELPVKDRKKHIPAVEDPRQFQLPAFGAKNAGVDPLRKNFNSLRSHAAADECPPVVLGADQNLVVAIQAVSPYFGNPVGLKSRH